MNINKSWEIPDVFQWIYKHSNMTIKDMITTYNCGIGMVVIFDKNVDINNLEDMIPIGKIIKSKKPCIDYESISQRLST